MYYDLHIHSALSPCASDDMTPNNIVNMALLKGLDVIAVCDHNSTKQLRSVAKVAKENNLKFIYGCELQTKEEVHILGLFENDIHIDEFQNWLNEKLPNTLNNEQYFGNELVLSDLDEVIDKETKLLINSLDASIEECVDVIHRFGGKVVLAHVLDRKNSITFQLGFIPENLDYDGIEVKSIEEIARVKKMHPHLKQVFWFIDSDAHTLIDINEQVSSISSVEYQEFWKK